MFDRVYLINLKRRRDRLDSFRLLQKDQGWELPEPEVFEAIEGDRVGPPPYFLQGGGAWGCLRSHVNCLERAIMDGVGSVLMLEDDATWDREAWDRLKQFMAVVPSDWDQLMLGGQHIRSAKPTHVPGVSRVSNCQRTHAYAIRGEALKSLLNLLYICDVHIDWKIGGEWQRNWKVYSPEPFIFAQAGGKSDISGRVNPLYSWADHKQPLSKTHLLVLRAPRTVVDNLPGFHRGYWLHSSGIDNGLLDVATSNDKAQALKTWVECVGREAERAGCVPMVWCDGIRVEDVRQATEREVVEIEAQTLEEVKRKWDSITKASQNLGE